MASIFGKIRQNLVGEGKTGKYLKYAIGEITLVVLGILIALQINNWNQNRQLEKEELKILRSLQESIKINIDEFNQTFDAQVRRNRSSQEVFFTDVSKQPLKYLDTLLRTNITNHTFDPSTGIYNSMINSGKIELISNDSLKNKISRLYDRVKDYQESEDEVTEYTKEHMEKSFINTYEIHPLVLAGHRKRTDEEENRDRIFYDRTLKSQEAKNIFILLSHKMSDVMTKGESLKSEYHSLVTELEKEIENKK